MGNCPCPWKSCGIPCSLEPREALPPCFPALSITTTRSAGHPAISAASSGFHRGRIALIAAFPGSPFPFPAPGAGPGLCRGCGAVPGQHKQETGAGAPRPLRPGPRLLRLSRSCSRSRHALLLLGRRNSSGLDVPRLRGRRHRLRFLGLNPLRCPVTKDGDGQQG